MTIKEIATIANVSVSTVSKVMNKNDDSISQATREKVLKVIKEYNYEPYSGVKANAVNSPFLVGILVDGRAKHESLLMNLISYIRRSGYTAIVSISYSSEEEYQNIALLSCHHVKGIIWDRMEDSSEECREYLDKQKIPCQVIGTGPIRPGEGYGLDYRSLSSQMTELLADKRHRQIVCLIDSTDAKSEFIKEGFKEGLFKQDVPFEAEMIQCWTEDRGQMGFLLHRVTGIICGSRRIAEQAYALAVSMNMNIPRELSILCLEEEEERNSLFKISSIVWPYQDIAARVVNQLVDLMEGRENGGVEHNLSCTLNHGESIDIPDTIRNKKIVVVGTINMDTTVRFDKLPESGETVTANTRVSYPGGKGMNQAVAVSRLGGEAFLIGKLGKDYDGSILHDYLKDNHVNVDGVSGNADADTGHAYIYVQEDGESSIAVYKGANGSLSLRDIELNEGFFDHASYCLIQTEISMEVVAYAVKKARQHGAKVILKPAAISKLDDEIVKYVDIFLPNKKEINRLLPEIPDYEGKAQYYLDRGAKNVIITLGHKGCYLKNEEKSVYFDPFDVAPVDTTGAADAFAAALGVFLSKDCDLETAIRKATIAAGISTTKPGAAPSMPDGKLLEMYLAGVK